MKPQTPPPALVSDLTATIKGVDVRFTQYSDGTTKIVGDLKRAQKAVKL